MRLIRSQIDSLAHEAAWKFLAVQCRYYTAVEAIQRWKWVYAEQGPVVPSLKTIRLHYYSPTMLRGCLRESISISWRHPVTTTSKRCFLFVEHTPCANGVCGVSSSTDLFTRERGYNDGRCGWGPDQQTSRFS